MDKNNVIGYKNDMPWSLPNDLKHFKNVTSHSTVIMGRKTYESIGKPLPNRRNIILSRSGYQTEDDVEVISSIDDIKVLAKKEEVFVIGGGTIYEQIIPYRSEERRVGKESGAGRGAEKCRARKAREKR